MIISPEQSLRILVIPREGRRPLFYYEPSIEEPISQIEGDDRQRARPTDFRGWVGRCVERARRLEHHTPTRLRSPIAWLKSRLPADERLLMSLRHADGIVFIHPTIISFEELESSWKGYLESRFQRRMIWFVLYLLILVPSIMLAMIPGPNVIGYWVTYRVVAHAMVLSSLIRASRNQILLESEKTGLLDGTIFTNRKEVERVQSQFHLFGLKRQIRRARVWQRLRRRRTPRQVASSPIEGSR
jgi:hypothetical protein